MKINNILTLVSKDKGLLIGLVFSLVTHLFLLTLYPSKEDKFCSLDNNSSVTLRALDTSLDSLANLPTYRDKNRIVTSKENQIPIVTMGGFAK